MFGSLRIKLLWFCAPLLIATTSVAVGASIVNQLRLAARNSTELENQVRQSLHSQGKLLTVSTASALNDLVAEFAFTDISALLERVVKNEPDALYGLLVDHRERVWSLIAPNYTFEKGSVEPVWQDIGLTKSEVMSEKPHSGAKTRFGVEVLEFSQPIRAEGDFFGNLIIGLSTRRMQQSLEKQRLGAREELMQSLIGSIAIVILIIIFGITLAWRFANKITYPLLVLTDATERFTKGDRTVNVDIKSGDEIQTLAQRFNEMVLVLNATLAGLEEAHADVNQRTIALAEQNRLLTIAKEEAKTASQAKNSFLATVSHELRTPLNGIIGMTEVLNEASLDLEYKAAVETIQTSGEALLALINDVLDFSKFESGGLQLRHGPLDLWHCIETSIDIATPRAREQQLCLIEDIHPSVPRGYEGDSPRLQKVLNYILGNAIKFTKEGIVAIVASGKPASRSGVFSLKINISDTGKGINPDTIEKIFQPFFQEDNSTTRTFGGTGLGLTISKKICELLDAKIHVESQVNIGSNFTIILDLPVLRPAIPCDPLLKEKTIALVSDLAPLCQWVSTFTQEHQGKYQHLSLDGIPENIPDSMFVILDGYSHIENLSEIVRNISSKKQTIILATSSQYSELRKKYPDLTCLEIPFRNLKLYTALKSLLIAQKNQNSSLLSPHTTPQLFKKVNPPKILVVDDNPVNLKVAKKLLERLGMTVDAVLSGPEAIGCAHEYNLIFMDLHMPEMTGLEATRQIRENLGSTSPIIIALTADTREETVRECLDIGMVDVLNKPVRTKDLACVLEQFLLIEQPNIK